MLDLLRRNRDFRTLWIAQVVSYAGDWFATVALLGLVRDQSGSDLLTALVFVVQSLPVFFASPFAGPVADRFDRRRVMIICSFLQVFAAMGFLSRTTASGSRWQPRRRSPPSARSSRRSRRPRSPTSSPTKTSPLATSLMSASWGAMLAIGAGLGGLFTLAFGRTAVFVANGAKSLRVRRHPHHLGASSDACGLDAGQEGTDATGARQRRRAAICVRGSARARATRSKAGFGLSAGLVSLVILLAEDQFGSGDGGTGLLLAARGAGAVIGPAFAYRLTTRGLGPVMTACGLSAIVNGVAYLMVPWSPGLAIATTLVFIAHLGSGTQWTLSTYGLQATTHDEIRGRIFATDFALVTLTISVSTLAGGRALRSFGAPDR